MNIVMVSLAIAEQVRGTSDALYEFVQNCNFLHTIANNGKTSDEIYVTF